MRRAGRHRLSTVSKMPSTACRPDRSQPLDDPAHNSMDAHVSLLDVLFAEVISVARGPLSVVDGANPRAMSERIPPLVGPVGVAGAADSFSMLGCFSDG